MARMSYPQTGEPRPEALPPERRTVGQLIAESLRCYGERFLAGLAIGIGPAVIAVVTVHVSQRAWLIVGPTLAVAILSACYTAACVVALKHVPSRRRLLVAWAVGWLVLVPVPFLVFAFVLPALAWLAAVMLVVPVLVVEDLLPRAALARAWRLARADYVHALGSLAALAIMVFLAQRVLAFLLRGAGDTELSVAFILANVVISPVFFFGAALLYVDQTARVK